MTSFFEEKYNSRVIFSLSLPFWPKARPQRKKGKKSIDKFLDLYSDGVDAQKTHALLSG
jgi:hypothetical protein